MQNSRLADDSAVTVSLTYEDADLVGKDETKLRVHRFNMDTGVFEPAGTRDVGNQEPTGVVGDSGLDMENNSAWVVVSKLGTFAVGVPEAAQVLSEQQDDGLQDQQGDTLDAAPNRTQCGAGAAPCGAFGMLNWMLMISGLVAMRRSYRSTASR